MQMARKCKKCPEREEITNVQTRDTKKYSFPSL
jgi:hypothetical protein